MLESAFQVELLLLLFVYLFCFAYIDKVRH